ncbi:hypothetical protein V5O48_006793 [Marasmius crinis-equi]|uniref:Uncharacterized protein n=1 Tax=Marasmius crinis-equi TaxID=585013 RepID=A0ABR3FIH2_9AGAR
MHFLAGLLLVSSAIAGPVTPPPGPAGVAAPPAPADESISFNNWNNISSLQGFDDFRGKDNYDGSKNAQVIVVQQQQQVCQTKQVEIIQQKLVVLQELAKRIITEQICEVEVQTIVLEQFRSGFKVFQQDVQRVTTRQVGFDEKIAAKISEIVNVDGTLSDKDLGFSGTDVGNNTVVIGGNNWDDQKSPEIVKKAQEDAEKAAAAGDKGNSTDSDSGPTRRWWLY